MNFKKIVSAASALTIAASAFASMAVVANAENPKETATLKQMKSWSADNKVGTTDVSTEKIHAGVGPSSNSSNYPGIAAAQFAFSNEDSLTVSKATLTFSATVSGSNRTLSVYTASNATYDFSNVPLFSTADGNNDGIYTQTAIGTNWTYSGIIGDLNSVYSTSALSGATALTVDVTEYVTAHAEDKMATFVFSNANAGADITNTVLTIEYASATAVEKDITINYVYGDENTAIPADSLPAGSVTSDKAYSDTSYTAVYSTTFDAVEDGNTYRYTYAGAEGSDTITVSADGTNVINLVYTRTLLQYVDVTVNAVDSENNTIKNIVSTNVLDGTVVSYGYSKYLTDENGKVTYVTNLTTYAGSVTASASDQSANTVNVPYTAYSGTAYFSEAESGTWASSNSVNGGALSGNTGNRVIADPSAALTIGEAGIYTITVPGFCRNVNNNSLVKVYKNSIADGNLIVSQDVIHSSQNAPSIVEATDVELAVGDTIIVTGTVGEALVDYVLAVKTGDVAPATTDKAYKFSLTEDSDDSASFTYKNVRVFFTEDSTEYKSEFAADTTLTINSTDSVIVKITAIPETVSDISVELY